MATMNYKICVWSCPQLLWIEVVFMTRGGVIIIIS